MDEQNIHTHLPIQPQQILLPKKVYIGDVAELRCNFSSNSPALKQMVTSGTQNISTNLFVTPLDAKDFEILEVKLSPAGIDFYQLSIIFKPWKTGSINFPALNLNELQIQFEPVSIVSITEQNNTSTLKDNLAPFLLPGTAYKLYGLLVILLIILITGIRLFIKRDKIRFYINNKRLLKKYKRNKKRTIRELNKLSREQIEDSLFSEKYQHIMRTYLETRFAYPFTKAATSEFIKGYFIATNNLASEEKQEAFEDITSTFIRTDYIRYKSGSKLFANEKDDLCKMVLNRIEILEGDVIKVTSV